MALQSTIETIDNLIGKLQSVEPKTQEYLDDNMESMFNQYVILEVKSIATAMNLPQKFVDGIKFVKTGKNEGKVVNTWGTPNEPFAKWFNNGVSPFEIFSTGDWALHWTSSLSGEEVYVSTKNKPVKHPGFPQTNAMEIGIEIGMKQLKANGNKDTSDFLQVEAEK